MWQWEISMRFNEETINYRQGSFSVFHDVCFRWFAEINGERLLLGFDFARGFDPVREREAVIRLGRDYIDCVL
jgi:hypothetical protein